MIGTDLLPCQMGKAFIHIRRHGWRESTIFECLYEQDWDVYRRFLEAVSFVSYAVSSFLADKVYLSSSL